MNTAKAHFGIRIAIVDDQVDQRERMIEFLRCMGHEVTGFALAEELDEYQACKTPDLMILELNLPGEDGCSITRRMRAAHPDMYILMLSSGTSVAERIRCYVSGADQHMGKPVSLPELALFVNNIARRLNLGRESFVPLSLNIVCLQLNGPVGTLPLSPSEMLLLKCLAEAPDRQLPYWYLQERLELDLDEKSKRSLEVRISRLKKSSTAWEPAYLPSSRCGRKATGSACQYVFRLELL